LWLWPIFLFKKLINFYIERNTRLYKVLGGIHVERKYNIVLSIFVALFIGTTILIGCSKAKEDSNEGGKSQSSAKSNETEKDSRSDDVLMGKKIAQGIEDIDGVGRATVFIKESTALVGVEMKDGSEVVSEELKGKIEAKVKEIYPNIRKVAVTADKELFENLDKMSNDFMNGKTMEELKKDLQEIMEKLKA